MVSKLLAHLLIFCFIASIFVSPVLADVYNFNVQTASGSVYSSGNFQGFGAEWDPFYWNTNNLNRGTNEAGWSTITSRIREMNVGIVRMMIQFYWVQESADLSKWNWNNPQAASLLKYLDFCKQNNIDVILTDWGWAVRKNMYSNPTDQRYAQGVAEYIKELIDRRGYTNIKYLVLGNEPDNELYKDFGMDMYVSMYHNVDNALKTNGMRSKIKLMGPDMGGQWDFMKSAIDRLKGTVDAYDFHRYASTAETSNIGLPGTYESLYSHLDMWRNEVNSRDSNGASKSVLLTEMGNEGGGTNSHPQIDTYDYALHMADYGTTVLKTRIDAAIAWTMHDIYYFDGGQYMEWGMWKYLDKQWSIRPWAQSFGLLIKYAPKGSTRLIVNGTPPTMPNLSTVRIAAIKRQDGKYSIFLINRDSKSNTINFTLPSMPTSSLAKIYFDRSVNIANPNTLILSPTSNLQPQNNYSIDLPAQSFTVLVEGINSVGSPSPSPNESKCSVIGDMSTPCDGVVNTLDLAFLLSKIGSKDVKADIDGSGAVNSLDLTNFLKYLGN